ncbi:hypothetical protein WG947_07930 [Pontibacter sp. H259]|uniref:hypothetical protein n=1 Tax=Pontibacter sp. H259 TaxID=3133421 RepID=UPI0030BCC2A5
MIQLKPIVKQTLRYPLMWVMLLWALTLPGHEVFVYDFLLKAIAGRPDEAITQALNEIYTSERQDRNDYVFTDAAPASYNAKLAFQPASLPSPGIFSFPKPGSYYSTLTYALKPASLQKLLLIAVLPNAP